jgi:RNA polymerase sigma factor (sigma-70 family)
VRTETIFITKVKDEILVQRHRDGDAHAFTLLIDKHTDRTVNYLTLITHCRQDAEDIFQDTCEDIYISISKGDYKEEEHFKNLFSKIAHNKAMDFLNKKFATRIDGYEYRMSRVTHRSYLLAKGITVAQIDSCIKQLSVKAQRIIIQHYYKGKIFKEIAAELHLDVGTVTKTASNAMERLAELLNIKRHKNAKMNDSENN